MATPLENAQGITVQGMQGSADLYGNLAQDSVVLTTDDGGDGPLHACQMDPEAVLQLGEWLIAQAIALGATGDRRA